MDARARLARNLQRIRRERGLTQEQLSGRTNIHQTYLSGIEGGKKNPTIDLIERLASALNVDISDLIERR